MKTMIYAMLLALVSTTFAGCAKKKQSQDIITQMAETPKPQAPVRMQEYTQTKDVDWLSRKYQVKIVRTPSDSLPMVKDETGQKFVDNRISLSISRQDGSVFFTRVFTKADFAHLLDKDYRATGILEGLVFDKVDDLHLCFASSVCHPQTDEYIPLVVRVSNFGEVTLSLDSDLDTNGGGVVKEEPAGDDGV